MGVLSQAQYQKMIDEGYEACMRRIMESIEENAKNGSRYVEINLEEESSYLSKKITEQLRDVGYQVIRLPYSIKIKW